jgi:5-aminolevulinate synthase
MKSDSHILPLFIGDPVKAKTVSDILLDNHRIYVQPINYPTVPKGEERLRISPSPLHTEQMMDDFVGATHQVWNQLGLRLLDECLKTPGMKGKFFELPQEGKDINIGKSHLYSLMDNYAL